MDYKDHISGQKEYGFWFKGKKEIIKILVSKIFKKGKRLNILNLGAGTGSDLDVLNHYGNVYVIDIEKSAIIMINKKFVFEKKVADACKIPYEDGFFDIVVSFDVFEHIKNDKKAVSEVYRVLKKGGILIFTVPAFNFLFSSHDRALHHKRRYNKMELKDLLYNFKGLKMYYWNSFLFVPIAFIRLFKKKSKPKLDHMNLPKSINSLFYFFLRIENFLIKYEISFPFGLSVVGFCRK
jgi:ubiquinone/menaquinone biosynthesis C-methylase UbiE